MRTPQSNNSEQRIHDLQNFIHGGISLREFLERDPDIRDVTAELERLAVQHWETIKRVREWAEDGDWTGSAREMEEPAYFGGLTDAQAHVKGLLDGR